jgi:hypothetical protein
MDSFYFRMRFLFFSSKETRKAQSVTASFLIKSVERTTGDQKVPVFVLMTFSGAYEIAKSRISRVLIRSSHYFANSTGRVQLTVSSHHVMVIFESDDCNKQSQFD